MVGETATVASQMKICSLEYNLQRRYNFFMEGRVSDNYPDDLKLLEVLNQLHSTGIRLCAIATICVTG